MLKVTVPGIRANTTAKWAPSDTKEIYNPLQADGMPNYTANEIEYTYNSDGFRCDEFSAPSDLPVLFLGCSFTEGIGLPLEEVWVYHYINKLRSLPQNKGKNIPLWSLALGGSGTDTMARVAYQHIDQIKPKHIIYVHSSWHRREYAYKGQVNFWLPSWKAPNDKPLNDALTCLYLDDSYTEWQSHRSLTILNLLARAHNSKIHILTNDPLLNESEMTHSNIVLYLVSDKVPVSKTLPGHILSKPGMARDCIHPGAVWQYNLYDYVWSLTKNEFE